MRWDFSVVPSNTSAGEVIASVVPYGLKIIKTLYDDSDVVMAVVDTTAEDAFTNAEPGFLQEYLLAARTLFVAQIDKVFTFVEGEKMNSSSIGFVVGSEVSKSLKHINILIDGPGV